MSNGGATILEMGKRTIDALAAAIGRALLLALKAAGFTPAPNLAAERTYRYETLTAAAAGDRIEVELQADPDVKAYAVTIRNRDTVGGGVNTNLHFAIDNGKSKAANLATFGNGQGAYLKPGEVHLYAVAITRSARKSGKHTLKIDVRGVQDFTTAAAVTWHLEITRLVETGSAE